VFTRVSLLHFPFGSLYFPKLLVMLQLELSSRGCKGRDLMWRFVLPMRNAYTSLF
jgi:hypothetical protein